MTNVVRFSIFLFAMSSFSRFALSDAKPWEDPGCRFERIDLGLSPENLAKAFVERDSKGEFLNNGDWISKAVECPVRLGGPDAITVIKNFKILQVLVSHDKATITVHYEIAGILSSGGKEGELNSFTAAPEQLDVNFKAIKTPHGWKLQEFRWLMVLADDVVKFDSIAKRKWVTGDFEKFSQAVK